MEIRVEPDKIYIISSDVDKEEITLKNKYTKEDLKQKIINYLYKKLEYTAEDVELIKLILKD